MAGGTRRIWTISERAGLRRNLVLLCAHHTLMMSLFPMAIITLYQTHELGLDMTGVMGLQAIFAVALAVFEFPSGVIADRVGYRASMIAASAISIVAWLVYAEAAGFWGVALAEVLLGLSLSLISGTNSAMLYETLVELDEEEAFGRWFGRARFFGQMGEGSAALVAGVLYAISFKLPFQLQAAIWVVALGVAAALVEPAFHRPVVENAWSRVVALLSYVRAGTTRLKATFTLSIFLGLSTFVPVWIVALYAEKAGVPVAWLGPVWAAANYVVALGSLASTGLERRFGVHLVLGTAVALVGVGYFGMGLSHALFGFAFYFALCLCRGLNGPLLSHEEHRVIPSGDRASFVSLRSLVFRLSFCVIGPATGWAIEQQGDHVVLLALGVFFTLGCGAALVAFRRSPAPEGAPPPLGT